MSKQRLGLRRLHRVWQGVFIAVVTLGTVVPVAPAYAAACSVPTTNYGAVTESLSVPADATYRVWTRIMAPDQSNNSYLLDVDSANCYSVGGGPVTPNVWTWVDYKDGNTAAKIDIPLTKGNHTLKLIGSKPNLLVDRIVAVSDLSCTVKDLGNTCVPPADTTAPQVTLTAPTNNATVSGVVELQANATDNVGVTRVDFLDNGTVIGTATAAPFKATWDTTRSSGDHTLSAKAYDVAGNSGISSVTITVNNGDKAAPTAPANVKASAVDAGKVRLTWTASTDDVAVTAYDIKRDGVLLQRVGAVTSFDDATVSPNTAYSYTVSARDAAGNASSESAEATVKTPVLTTADTQAPSVPANVRAEAVSSAQITLKWDASTDNVGVKSYDVYRKQGSGRETRVATVATTSFGDTGLVRNTQYSYRVQARDAANNASAYSNTAVVTTKDRRAVVTVRGQIRNADSNNPVRGARVVFSADGRKVVYGARWNGRYTMKFYTGGSYQLTYQARGYESKTIPLSLADGETLEQNVRLERK